MSAALRIAIVGGGLGGLAAALYLRREGIEATVYEQAPRLRDVGAGVVVAPNMVRPLARLGLAGELARCAVKLEAAWEFRRYADGRVLSVQPMGQACERLYGAPCYVAHRADLLAMLQAALPAGQLRLGHRCVGVTQAFEQVHLRFECEGAAGQAVAEVAADAVIGADGIHSAVSAALHPKVAARFSGLAAFRCLIPAERANAVAWAMALRPVQTLWLGPGRHVVHYPISAGRLVNLVAIGPAGSWRTESWSAEGRLDELIAEVAGWDPRIRELAAAAESTRRWALYDRDPLPSWTLGRATLLGDAAHAMLPFFAQGAAQAIEDAVVLAACLRGASRGTLPAALARYEAIRRPRASQVQLMSRGRELRNHLPDGPAQAERDAELARGDPLAQSAWLYGYDAEAAAAAAA